MTIEERWRRASSNPINRDLEDPFFEALGGDDVGKCLSSVHADDAFYFVWVWPSDDLHHYLLTWPVSMGLGDAAQSLVLLHLSRCKR